MMRKLLLSATCLSLVACSTATVEPPPVNETAVYKHSMVTAANPLAVQAGAKVLENGGNAVDAAIAVHSVLSLVEPQSSGLGGGAFMVVYEAKTGELTFLDGREKAPAKVDEKLFYTDDGKVMDYITAWQSGRSVGVPGQVALYEKAHSMFGLAEWGSLFEDAITLGEDGFEVSPRLAGILANERLRKFMQLDDNPDTAPYFYPNGEPLAAGTLRDNPEFAATLRAIVKDGAKVFYEGEIADAIVKAVQGGAIGGAMTTEDLASYEVAVRSTLCGEALGYKICSAEPPSSGGVTQPAILGLYERLIKDVDADDKNAKLKAFVDAQRLAYADRDHYVADADFVTVPAKELIEPKYLDARVKDKFAPDAVPTAGDPGEVLYGKPMIDMWGRDATDDAPGTTHISVVDKWGNAVSMTATVESAFGSSRWAKGFLLNNELTDFSREAYINGKIVANAPAGNKRPRSSMSPTLVFDKNDDLYMVTGSPGGNSIVAYTSKTLVGVLDWGMTVQEAVDYPNVIARGEKVGVENTRGELGAEVSKVLTDYGYKVQEGQGEGSGLHAIVVKGDELEGAADPRREGIVIAVE